jgi:aerobic carbon-monoxide dehydrogenase large subunit
MPKYVGARTKRKEDPRLIRGMSTYVDDVKLHGMLHVAIVRSPHAHARLKSIEATAALKLPGVVAVFTAQDVGDKVGSVPCAAQIPDLKVPKHPVLAVGKVRYVGESVAAVVAQDRYIAADAASLIEVDYEPLSAVVDPLEALEPGATVIHEEWKDNLAFKTQTAAGDVEEAFKAAEVPIIKQRMLSQRLIPMAMETRGVVAQYQAGDNLLTLWSSSQIPHLLRTQVAVMLNLPENHVRVIVPEVGGGFGSKLNVYREEALLGFLAMKLRRPLKWIEGRRENFVATIHGRDQIDDVEIAVKKDGTILGLKLRIVADLGAYHQLLTPLIPGLTGAMITGCYRFPNVSIETIGVFTNKMATDAYRGAGRPEATYIIERAMDLVAAALKLDPVEVRRSNFVPSKSFPYSTPTGLTYDSANYEACFQKALDIVNYQQLREEQSKLRAQGRYLGIGISTYVEICAMGPSSGMPAGGWESATVRVEPTGKVTILTGSSPHGQGQETTFAQIAADELGVDFDDIIVQHGDTGTVQYGIGTFGSRATAVGGTAVYMAVQKLKEKAGKLAAHLLKTDSANFSFETGRLVSQADASKALSFFDIAQSAYHAKSIPSGFEPGLEATAFFEPSNYTFPFGAHIAVVEVDPETGEIQFKRYVGVDDCGRIINPLTVHGQVQGGIAQGLGQALLEEAVYDESGQLITGTLMDYAIPKATDLPWFELDKTETPSPVNPLGVKGVGEAGTIGSTPAIVNAVVDALSPFGVRHIDMPLKSEKVWKSIQAGTAK